MSFKDFVAFGLKMYGFFMVINSLIGIGYTSIFITDVVSQNSQFWATLAQVLVPLLIGSFLFFMPYKVTNFLVASDIEVAEISEFYNVLTRVGFALLGLYVVITGLQFLLYNIVTFSHLADGYSEFDDFEGKRNAALASNALRVVLGLTLVLGSSAISSWLTKTWVMARK